jgi:hypothetical protein
MMSAKAAPGTAFSRASHTPTGAEDLRGPTRSRGENSSPSIKSSSTTPTSDATYAATERVNQAITSIQTVKRCRFHGQRIAGEGAGIEPVRLTPLWEDCRGEWGHVGPMDFGIGVQNIKKAVETLKSLGIETHSDIQVLDVGNTEFKYVYFKDPDDQYVSLVESNY